ncbi:MAG: ShlB/FhaC/HecB family hemolysin secretion/activation protein [Xenococcus sp. MO_188.B8]|nr:ShlB/FhaC/HecB family hemolysin secretion/activation protein [Xenococcus sp. MO_188.B8]
MKYLPSTLKFCQSYLWFILLFPAPIQAQTVPLPASPRQPELKEPELLPPQPEILPAPERPSLSPQLAPAPIPDRILVRKFEVIGNTVFTQAELDRVLKPYTLRRISFTELLEAQRAVTQLYLDNGYISSGAFIPPQDIDNRVVKIQVIEGIVEAIEVTGLKRLNTGYVRSRLAIATEPPLNQNKLLNALQLLRLDPLIGNLSAELAAGVRPGSSILEVKVQEADAFSIALGIDNYNSPSVGTDRRLVRISHDNLVGWGDRISAFYYNTDGRNSLDELSYTIPVNPRNGTIGFRFSYTDSDIIEEPFNQLDIESQARRYNLTYRQPVYQTPANDVAIGLTFSRQESETSLLGTPFRLSRGASEDGETRISALRFFQEYTNRNERQVFALRSQFSIGIDAFDATINSDDDIPDSKFISWRGQAQYLRQLTPDIGLLLRSDVQVSDRPLLPLEQISLGGAFTVRGYRQDALVTDNGFFASAELRTTVARIPKWSTTIQLTPFTDFGIAWNNNGLELDQNTLVSVGIGLRVLASDLLTARLDWGIPLIDLEDSGDTLQENGIYFSIELRPF